MSLPTSPTPPIVLRLGLALGLAAAVALAASCCAEEPVPDARPAARAAWTPVPAEELAPAEAEAVAAARAAKKELAGRLVGRLTEVLSQQGPAAAIEVCHLDAPRITGAVAEEQGLRLGRTSHRLRNPMNAPPPWAEPWVAERHDQPLVLRGPDGRLGILDPIPLQPLCVTCHGPQESIPTEVAERLAALYPEDRATGFRPGDLRGWFWMETRAEEGTEG